ncbi:MAG: restriction endonuclease [bacterium]|nr:restriction endonuclease [bacterium]
MDIIKASGISQRFSAEKLYSSIKRAGVKPSLAEEISKTVAKGIKAGADTGEILSQTLSSLKKENPILAAKYNLKKAIMELGPAGFTFEKYVAEIFKEYGYTVSTNEQARGRCVSHEIDVVAQKEGQRIMIECKYHNERGIRSDTKVALYTFARFLDVKNNFNQAWLVTNTKCTNQAILYARCAGLKIISWRYPRNESLEYLIEKKKLYPITSLPLLSKYAREKLVERQILLAKDLLKYSLDSLARMTGLELNIAEKLQAQAKELCF